MTTRSPRQPRSLGSCPAGVASLFGVLVLLVLTTAASAATQLSQFGVTWTFDRDYASGQYANGDYWVIGPVTIINLDPASHLDGDRVVNGSMINPSPRSGEVQGYDSAMRYMTFDPALNVARPGGIALCSCNPLVVPTHSSLVSTISVAEAGHRPQLSTAAILTVVAETPDTGSFRPAYCGADKTSVFTTAHIDASQLTSLAPVALTPALATVERYFERPWLDHIPGWAGEEYAHSVENLPNYGREAAAQIGDGALCLLLDFSLAEKQTLLIRYLQLGVDLWGVIQDGGTTNWLPNGGHSTGYKWPILFAGLVLGSPEMVSLGSGDGSGTASFAEDSQTFYVTAADISRSHNPDLRSCFAEEYQPDDLGLPEWGIRHATEPERDNHAWCAIYRRCCTANAWSGFVLAAHIMGAVDAWGHTPLFAYQDRYMATEPVGEWTRSFSDFAAQMWDTYRASYPLIPPHLVFADGFESGETTAWSQTTP